MRGVHSFDLWNLLRICSHASLQIRPVLGIPDGAASTNKFCDIFRELTLTRGYQLRVTESIPNRCQVWRVCADSMEW
jgi:hypothetical protein